MHSFLNWIRERLSRNLMALHDLVADAPDLPSVAFNSALLAAIRRAVNAGRTEFEITPESAAADWRGAAAEALRAGKVENVSDDAIFDRVLQHRRTFPNPTEIFVGSVGRLKVTLIETSPRALRGSVRRLAIT